MQTAMASAKAIEEEMRHETSHPGYVLGCHTGTCQENPLVLKAYDSVADKGAATGDGIELISPVSILLTYDRGPPYDTLC